MIFIIYTILYKCIYFENPTLGAWGVFAFFIAFYTVFLPLINTKKDQKMPVLYAIIGAKKRYKFSTFQGFDQGRLAEVPCLLQLLYFIETLKFTINH